MESDKLINEKIQMLIEEVESALYKLERSFSINKVTKGAHKTNNGVEKNKNSHNEIRGSLEPKEKKESVKENKLEEVDSSKAPKDDKNLNVKPSYLKLSKNNLTTKSSTAKNKEETIQRQISKTYSRTKKYRTLEQLILTSINQHTNGTEQKISDHESYNQEPLQEFHVIDIPFSTRIIHINGGPASGKTTLALQAAFEVLPKKTVLFYYGTTIPIIKRVQEMISSRNLSDSCLKEAIYLVPFDNLADLLEKIRALEKMDNKEIGLVIVDNITSPVRGEVYKEEIRNDIRTILEELIISGEKNNYKSFIINCMSYKGKPVADDLIESYADYTITLHRNGPKIKLSASNNVFETELSEKGFESVIINIYY